MIFDFQIPFTGGAPTTTVPDTKRVPNLTIPNDAHGKPLSGVGFALYAPAGGNLDLSVYALIESSDDRNAVDDFAETQTAPREWVLINAFTVTHDSTFINLTNLTPGRYYVRVSGGTATAGKLLGAML